MSPTTLALFFVSLVIIGTATDVGPAAKGFQFFLSSEEHEKSLFFTVEGTIALNTKISRGNLRKRSLYICSFYMAFLLLLLLLLVQDATTTAKQLAATAT